MSILIKYFGALAEATGCHEQQVHFSGQTLSDLMTQLKHQYALDQHDIMVAVNHHRVDSYDAIALKPNDEVALLPPFAGG